MPYDMPKTIFEPHPAGRHTGCVTQVKDEGMQDTPWGQKRKISIWITSDSAIMNDGEGCIVVSWFTLSSSEKSNLTKFRQQVLDRRLGDDELAFFDENVELMNKRIHYRIDHVEKQDGGIRAVIREGSIDPAKPVADNVRPLPRATTSVDPSDGQQPPTASPVGVHTPENTGNLPELPF